MLVDFSNGIAPSPPCGPDQSVVFFTGGRGVVISLTCEVSSVRAVQYSKPFFSCMKCTMFSAHCWTSGRERPMTNVLFAQLLKSHESSVLVAGEEKIKFVVCDWNGIFIM